MNGNQIQLPQAIIFVVGHMLVFTKTPSVDFAFAIGAFGFKLLESGQFCRCRPTFTHEILNILCVIRNVSQP